MILLGGGDNVCTTYFISRLQRMQVSSTSCYGGYLWRSISAKGPLWVAMYSGLTYTLKSVLVGFWSTCLYFSSSFLLCGICLHRSVEINSFFSESVVIHSLFFRQSSYLTAYRDR
jgi:hypothetical protein